MVKKGEQSMRKTISRPRVTVVAILLMAPLLGCGSGETPPATNQARPTQGEQIMDHGAPGESGGAPQDPAGQDAPSPDAPAPEAP